MSQSFNGFPYTSFWSVFDKESYQIPNATNHNLLQKIAFLEKENFYYNSYQDWNKTLAVITYEISKK
jgi:hypothetical protein